MRDLENILVLLFKRGNLLLSMLCNWRQSMDSTLRSSIWSTLLMESISFVLRKYSMGHTPAKISPQSTSQPSTPKLLE